MQDITKYIKDESKDDVLKVVQNYVGAGIQHVELRDEIYCQMMRQCTDCPEQSYQVQAWSLMCLITASFSPSKNLHKVRNHRKTIKCYFSMNLLLVDLIVRNKMIKPYIIILKNYFPDKEKVFTSIS